MIRTAAMKTLYLASAFGTLMLLGCSGSDSGEDTPQQAGKSGTAGAKSLFGGLAGAGTVGSGGSSGAGVSSNAGAPSAGAPSAGAPSSAASGGASAAGPFVGSAGVPNGGRDSIGFAGLAGFPGLSGAAGYGGGIHTVLEGGFAGEGSVQFGFGGSFQIGSGGSNSGVAGTGIWISP